MKIFSREIFLSIALFPIIFLAISVIFLIGGYTDFQADINSTDITATVSKCEFYSEIDLDDNPVSGYNVYINYTYDGISYKNVYWKNSNNLMTIGDNVSVKVNSDNPTEIVVSNSFALFIIGGVLFVFSVILCFKMIPHSISITEATCRKNPKNLISKRNLFLLIPIFCSFLFFILGLNVSIFFHIGFVVFLYFTVVLFEILN